MVNLLSWRYRDPGLALGELIGARDPGTRYTGIGGNVPQTLVNQACLDIMAGRAEVVLLAGAETWRTRKQQKANGIRPNWTSQDESVAVPPGAEDAVDMSSPAQDRIKLALPSHVYPLFEEALRVAAGEAPDDHRRRIAELWARFNEVAQHNPHAWSNRAYSADEIGTAGPQNRMISWPYTKLLNSNNMVDQGAALILTSVEKATYLQIPSERWIFPWSGTDAHDTYAVAERWEYHRSPAIRIGAQRALELAGLDAGDVDLIDIYSCFPSAVQVAANEIGVPIDDPARPLTVTGGLTFAGGPWNNYVMHSIATMTGLLRADPKRPGLLYCGTEEGIYISFDDGARWQNFQLNLPLVPVTDLAVKNNNLIAATQGRSIWMIDDLSVSRQHCRVWRKRTEFVVEDLGATNKTRVNDAEIEEYSLRDKDLITVGEVVLKFLGANNPEGAMLTALHDRANRDALTGVLNRRAFMAAMQRETQRSDRPCTLALLDIDHFKSINDKHGHPVGDQVLKAVAHELEDHVRGSEVLARVGGEEFALLMPGVTPAEAAPRVEAWRAAIEALVVENAEKDNVRVPVTASFGYAALDAGGVESLYRRADHALYLSKQGGRNRATPAPG